MIHDCEEKVAAKQYWILSLSLLLIMENDTREQVELWLVGIQQKSIHGERCGQQTVDYDCKIIHDQ
jgi:hypothetical protein